MKLLMDEWAFAEVIFSGIWLSGYWILFGLVNMACAYFVCQDAIQQTNRALNIGPPLVGFFLAIGGRLDTARILAYAASTLVKSRD